VELMARYKLAKSPIYYILDYEHPERARPGRTRRPRILSNAKINKIIEYLSDSWDNRCLNWTYLRDEFKLTCILE
jgi:hypothetical protein